MTELIPDGKTCLLLVEGQDDKEFFVQLVGHESFKAKHQLHIHKYGGVTKLAGVLNLFSQDNAFHEVARVAIVRDADFGTNAFESVRQAILNSNKNSSRAYPVPDQPLVPVGDSPWVNTMILPSSEREGMLENLMWDALKGDTIAACADEFFGCLERAGKHVTKERLSKARVRVYISGKNASDEATGDDSDKGYLSDIYKMSWWRENNLWDHSAFDDAKAFLTQLLAD